MKKLFMLVAVLALVVPAAARAQSYRVVVNPSNPVDAISAEEAERLFLKKTTKWSDGRAVTPIDLKASADARSAFSEEVLGRPVPAIKAYWQQKVFAGREVPPTEAASDSEVIALVRAEAGAIGYVSAGADLSNVRVVRIVP